MLAINALSDDGRILAVGGNVQVFEFANGDWAQMGNITIFAYSLALSGDGTILAIGTRPGQVRVLEWDTTEWLAKRDAIPGNEFSNEFSDRFGYLVKLSKQGDVLAVAGPISDFTGGKSSKGNMQIFLFDIDSSTWVQMGQELQGFSVDSWFGLLVSLASDGATIVIGAFSDHNGPASGQAQVYQYDTIEGNWSQLGQTLNGDTSGDVFGSSVALSGEGSTLAVGASDAGVADVGLVHIFHFDDLTSSWKILNDIYGQTDEDFLGRDVALSRDGSTIVAGVNADAGTVSGYSNCGNWPGSVFVFNVPSCLLEQCLSQVGSILSGQQIGSEFGAWVSTSQNGAVVAVGAGGAGEGRGFVQVFQYENNTQWNQLGSNIEGESIGDYLFSNALSDDGSILAVGAPFNEDNGFESGHIQVYRYDDNEHDWIQMGDTLVGLANGNVFGVPVVLSGDGNILAVGAHLRGAGEVWVFAWNGEEWMAMGDTLNGKSSGDEFGWSMSLFQDGSVIAIGATQFAVDNVSGYVQIYKFSDSSWRQVGEDIIGENPQGKFGFEFGIVISLSLNGNTVVIMASGNCQAKVYHLEDDSLWYQLGQTLTLNAAGLYELGCAVSLSGDASILAVGEPAFNGEESDSRGLHIFGLEGASWQQIGNSIAGSQTGDESGSSVALSRDCSVVAVGAPGYNSKVLFGTVAVLKVDMSCRPESSPSPTTSPTKLVQEAPVPIPQMSTRLPADDDSLSDPPIGLFAGIGAGSICVLAVGGYFGFKHYKQKRSYQSTTTNVMSREDGEHQAHNPLQAQMVNVNSGAWPSPLPDTVIILAHQVVPVDLVPSPTPNGRPHPRLRLINKN